MKRRDFLRTLAVSGLGVGMRVFTPAAITAPCPLVIYHHGSNELANSINPPTDGKTALIPALQNAGYIVCASDAHGNNWGNQASIEDYVNLAVELAGQCITSRTLFLSQSMGGHTGLLCLVDGRIPNVKGWYGIYPAVNLADNYAGMFTAAIDTAYNINGGNPYAIATAGHDANLINAASFPNIRYRASASPGDTVVPKTQNWDLMASKLSGKVEASTLAATGEHGDGSHFSSTDLLDFFSRCV